MNRAELNAAAARFGADMLGVAPVARFAGLPQASDPLAIFPQAKSMIVVGRRIPRGVLRGMAMADGRAESPFRHFGLLALEDNYLAKTTYDLAIWIEARGFEAVPMFGYDTEAAAGQPLGAPVSPDKPAPNVYVDWKFAAQAAGLGVIGRHGLFLTPEFGVRQRFAMLLCDFEFEPDPVAVAAGFCTDCRACIDACPHGALSESGRDDALCRKCRAGAVRTDFGRFHTVERIGAACGRACPVALKTNGRTGRERIER